MASSDRAARIYTDIDDEDVRWEEIDEETMEKMKIPVAQPQPKPRMTFEAYPWENPRYQTRNDKDLRSARRKSKKCGVSLNQSTVTDKPGVLGVFAERNFKEGNVVAPGFVREEFAAGGGSGGAVVV